METTTDKINKDGSITRTYTRVTILTPEEYQAEIDFKESNLLLLNQKKEEMMAEINSSKDILTLAKVK